MFVYRVKSDNYKGVLMTPQAYAEIKLNMSSGDFGSHGAKLIKLSSVKSSEKIAHFWKDHLQNGMSGEDIADICWDALSKAQVKAHGAYVANPPKELESVVIGSTPDNVYSLEVYRAKYPEVKSAFAEVKKSNLYLERKERIEKDRKANNKFVIANPTSKRY